jgi:HAD superfamily hydrolase (TIGR01490 family)
VTDPAAAFFDLDKTVIAKASMVAFSGPLHRAGMLSRRMLLRAAWSQLVYAQFGASSAKLAKLRDSVLRLTRGWDHVEISAIVREALVDVVEPIVFDEAIDLIREHQAAGRKVFIVSASPEEVVAPLAQFLGVDEALATRAELDADGRYTGRTERYCYGPEKVVAMREAAGRDGIDLSMSYAYSDSATDLPMLEAVGHPVVVNPDRELQRAARARGWEVRRFSRRVPLRDRVPMPAPRHAALGGGAVVLAAGAGLAARWLWDRRRSAPAQPPARHAFVARWIGDRRASASGQPPARHALAARWLGDRRASVSGQPSARHAFAARWPWGRRASASGPPAARHAVAATSRQLADRGVRAAVAVRRSAPSWPQGWRAPRAR